jgi:plastocyanin
MTKRSLAVPGWGFLVLTAIVTATIAAAPRASAPSLRTARITGIVTVTAATRAPLASAAYASRRIAVPSNTAGSELANVVVFVKGAAFDGALPRVAGRMVQQDEQFVPRLLAITRGSVVEFPNDDPYFHDVFSLSKAAAFDLGSYARGKSRSMRFTKAGLVKVFCHLHSHMSASIMVFDHPYFAMPEADGSFAIDNLPPGRYTVSAWHERIGESSHAVVLTAGGTAEVQFSLPVVER